MKPKTRIRKAAKSARHSIIKKAASKKAIVQKAVKKAAVKKMARKLPHSIQMRRGPAAKPAAPKAKAAVTPMESARGVFVRFSTPQMKEAVRKAAKPGSLNSYVCAITLAAARRGEKVQASAVTGSGDEYRRRMFVRWENAREKDLVEKAARQQGVSLSVYVTQVATQAAKAGWKPEAAAAVA